MPTELCSSRTCTNQHKFAFYCILLGGFVCNDVCLKAARAISIWVWHFCFFWQFICKTNFCFFSFSFSKSLTYAAEHTACTCSCTFTHGMKDQQKFPQKYSLYICMSGGLMWWRMNGLIGHRTDGLTDNQASNLLNAINILQPKSMLCKYGLTSVYISFCVYRVYSWIFQFLFVVFLFSRKLCCGRHHHRRRRHRRHRRDRCRCFFSLRKGN